ncbi:MAG: cation transporter [Rhodocyclaceae bacterium]|nr:cation transporter [Rhodocyclaceae bacterium]
MSSTTAAERSRAASHVTWVSIAVNLLLTTLQIVVGILAHAQSLVADGFHSLADVLADFMVLAANKHSGSPADEDHPYGHERIETLASLALGVVLLLTGAGILYAAIGRLQHLDDLPPVASIALWTAFATIAGKELLFRYMLRVGERLRSPMLIANAWHARADAASSLVVAAGIGGSLLGWRFLDPIAAIVVGLMVMRMGWRFSWEALAELVDTGIPSAERDAVMATVLATPGILACHSLRSRRMAHKVLVDARVQVSPRISVSEGHRIAETVHDRVLAEHIDVLDVMVHIDVEPDGTRDARQQPGRLALLAALQQSGLADLDDTRMTLHYLDSGLEIVLDLPPDLIVPAPEILLPELHAQFPQADPPVASVTIRRVP